MSGPSRIAAVMFALAGAPLLADERVDREFARGLEEFDAAAQLREQGSGDVQAIRAGFARAAAIFAALWEEGVTSTELATNAGNSHWFADRRGEAVLFYRRALAVDPSNRAARGALDEIRAAQPVQPGSGSASLAESLFFWHDRAFLRWRAWAFCLLFPAAWILFAIEAARRRWPALRALWIPVLPAALLALAIEYLFRVRRPFATVGVLCLLPALTALASLVIEAIDDPAARQAVTIVAAEGRNGNGSTYGPSHRDQVGAPIAFPAGTEVEVRATRAGAGRDAETWVDVELRDGSRSWLPASAIEYVHGEGESQPR